MTTSPYRSRRKGNDRKALSQHQMQAKRPQSRQKGRRLRLKLLARRKLRSIRAGDDLPRIRVDLGSPKLLRRRSTFPLSKIPKTQIHDSVSASRALEVLLSQTQNALSTFPSTLHRFQKARQMQTYSRHHWSLGIPHQNHGRSSHARCSVPRRLL
jgi:hypothetical protein